MSLIRTVQVNSAWTDLYTASGIVPGTPIRVINRSPYDVFLQAQGTAPVSVVPGEVGWPIPAFGTFSVSAGEAKAWVFGQATISVEEDWPSLQHLDGLWDGRGFRISHRYSIPASSSIVLRYDAAKDFILKSQSLAGIAGDVQFDAIAGGTEGGTFSTSVFVRGTNITTRRPTPLYTNANTITTGGTLTGGTITETFDCFAAGGSKATNTVSGAQDFRFLAGGNVYYLKFTNVGSGTANGVYSIQWEELP